ncbi:MAG: DUF460 domain-containing protein [Desulfurococcales archaeon]|nr:DUF460 domain-containing protein [Desulfurococcales archaeon]
MGVDLESGNPGSYRRPLYHVVIINGEGRVIENQESVPLPRLIRLVWQYRPDTVAFDNIMELADNRKTLTRILEMFPVETRIVQVTLDKTGFRSMRELAKPYRDLVGPGKLTPGRTAYLAALLASQGQGTPVRVVEQRTLITVSKARSPTGGGYSQQRYQRRVRASVLNATMRVKEALDRAGLDYDMSYRRSEGGLESAVFTVYASREKLVGIVRPHRGLDYVVDVKPVYKVNLNIGAGEPPRTRPVIVGVDPGITTGLAVIDLKGRILLLESGKNLDRGALLDKIARTGRPILVAVDVRDPPETVKKLAAQLGASIYSPPSDLSIAEKRALAAKALRGSTPEDSHQRDALAAALKALQVLDGKLKHVESQVRRIGLDINVNTVKEAVLRGLTVAEALEAAIEQELESLQKTPAGSGETRRKSTMPNPRGCSQQGSELEIVIEHLKSRIRELEDENERLREDIERRITSFKAEVYRDSLLEKMTHQIEILTGQVETLKSELASSSKQLARMEDLLVRVWKRELVVAPRLRSLTVSNIRRVVERMGSLEGEILYLENPVYEEKALDEAKRRGVLGIIVTGSVDVSLLAKAARKRLIPVVLLNSGGRPEYLSESIVVLPAGIAETVRRERRALEEAASASLRIENIIKEYRIERSRRG